MSTRGKGSGSGAGEEATLLAQKLEGYVLNLRQVEAALEIDPTHTELIKIKADLNELIELTKKLLSDRLASGGPSKTGAGYHGSGAAAASTARGSVATSSSSSAAPATATTAAVPGLSGMSSSSVVPPVATMITSIKTLRDEQYKQFMIQAFDESRPPDCLRHIIKYMTSHGRKARRRQNKVAGQHRPNQANSDDDESSAGETGHCNGSVGPGSKTNSAGNAPLIYRGEMLSTESDVLFMTVKQIRLKPTLYSDHKMVAGIICLVNSQKQLAFYGVVKWKPEDICQTFPNSTGVTVEMLQKGLPFSQIITLLLMAIEGKLLIGYKLEEDLQALSISHDRKEDLADYFRDKEGPYGLEDLKHSLGIGLRASANEEAEHYRVVHETKTLCGLYGWKKNNQSLYATFDVCANIDVLRKKRIESQTKAIKDAPGEICQCTV